MRARTLVLLLGLAACSKNAAPMTGPDGGSVGADGGGGGAGADRPLDATAAIADAAADVPADQAGPDSRIDVPGAAGDTSGLAEVAAAADAPRPDTGETGAGDQCTGDEQCPPIHCTTPPCADNLCVLGDDGFRRCRPRERVVLDACPVGAPVPCCTADSQCTQARHGRCVPWYVGHCGGVPPMPGNVCRYDQCLRDSDCTAMPRGVCTGDYPRECRYGPCRTSADCTRRPGGRCVLDRGSTYCDRAVTFCRYADDPCRTDADCAGGQGLRACLPNNDGHGVSCRVAPPPPP